MSDLENKLLAGVDAILGPDSLITKSAGSHLRYSAQQHQYARLAASGFSRFDPANKKTAINLLQAATGTGKTLGYLVPLMLFSVYQGARVGVSTFTRHLQKQIIDQDALIAADWVATLTGQRVSVGLRMGINNFVSEVAAARLHDTLSRLSDDRYEDALDFLDNLIDWAGESENSGLLYDFLEEQALNTLPFGVTPESVALEHTSPDDDKSAFIAMVNASKDVDLLVVNHSLLVTNALRWSALLDDPDKRPIATLVCDEADRLPLAAESVTGSGISLHNLVKTCDLFGNEKALLAVTRLQDYVRSIKVPAKEAQAVNNRSELSEHLRATLNILRPIGKECAASILASSTGDDSAAIAQKTGFLDAIQQLDAVNQAIGDSDTSSIISWSPVREYPSLRVGRPHPGRVLSRLWNLRRDAEDSTLPPLRGYLDAVLMTSATLETPGRDLPRAFDEFAASVGVVRHLGSDGEPVHNVTTNLFARFEPSKFGRMQFVIATPSAPLPSLRTEYEDVFTTNPQWLDFAAAMIRAAHATGGRTLALTLSWRDSVELASRLSDLATLVEHRQGDSLHDVAATYATTENAVLITPSAWEGLDLPGLVQNLVITRIPFSPSNTSIDAQKIIHYEHRGYSKDTISAILHNEKLSVTRRKLVQGLGRGIRKHDDAVVVWIGDPRFPLSEETNNSLDPVLMDAPVRRSQSWMRFCIPERFRESTYPQARLFLEDGKIHSLTDI